MAEYIEREAAIEAVTVWYKKACRPENMSSYNMGERAAYTTAISEIAEIPAADVVARDCFDSLLAENDELRNVRPVVRGKWELEYEPNGKPYCFHCSVCDGDFHYIGITTKYDFCPNCGADMGEES